MIATSPCCTRGGGTESRWRWFHYRPRRLQVGTVYRSPLIIDDSRGSLSASAPAWSSARKALHAVCVTVPALLSGPRDSALPPLAFEEFSSASLSGCPLSAKESTE